MMAKAGEKTVKEYLEIKGLQVVKIPESDIKTADFAVYSRSELFFYLEEKTIELTALGWKNVDPIYNSIARHIYEAMKQFKSINPKRDVPNVLAFTNQDPARSINDLFITLTGYVITMGGKMRRIHGMKKLENESFLIALYLWFDNDQLTGHIWEENNLEHEAKLAAILGLE